MTLIFCSAAGWELTGVLLQDSSALPSPFEVGETSVSNMLPSSASPHGAASCRHKVWLALAQSAFTLWRWQSREFDFFICCKCPKNRSLNKKMIIIIKLVLYVELHVQPSVWCIYGKLLRRHKREPPRSNPTQSKKANPFARLRLIFVWMPHSKLHYAKSGGTLQHDRCCCSSCIFFFFKFACICMPALALVFCDLLLLFCFVVFFLPVLLQWPLRADPAAEECVS